MPSLKDSPFDAKNFDSENSFQQFFEKLYRATKDQEAQSLILKFAEAREKINMNNDDLLRRYLNSLIFNRNYFEPIQAILDYEIYHLEKDTSHSLTRKNPNAKKIAIVLLLNCHKELLAGFTTEEIVASDNNAPDDVLLVLIQRNESMSVIGPFVKSIIRNMNNETKIEWYPDLDKNPLFEIFSNLNDEEIEKIVTNIYFRDIFPSKYYDSFHTFDEYSTLPTKLGKIIKFPKIKVKLEEMIRKINEQKRQAKKRIVSESGKPDERMPENVSDTKWKIYKIKSPIEGTSLEIHEIEIEPIQNPDTQWIRMKYAIHRAGEEKAVETREFMSALCPSGNQWLFLNEKTRWIPLCGGHDDLLVYMPKPEIKYEEKAQEEEKGRAKRKKYTSINEEEKKMVMEHVSIEGDTFNGKKLDREALQRMGLIPKSKVILCGRTIFFSPLFIANGLRKACIAYVQDGDKFTARTFYQSQSHALWRVLTHYKFEENQLRFLGKGRKEEGVNAPFEIQKFLEGNGQELLTFDEADYNLAMLGTAGESTYKRYVRETEEYPKNLLQKKEYPQEIDFVDQADRPDFEKMSDSFYLENHPLYGKVKVEIFHSKNRKFRFAFLSDKWNRVWMAEPQVAKAKINSFGVISKYIDEKEISTSAFEYPSNLYHQFLNFGCVENAYADAFFYFLSRIPIIQAYCTAKNITQTYRK